MCSIILIATGHRENGLCDSNELYKIIEKINPEIIFEEIPSDKFSAVYEGKLSDSLEISTIKKYLQKYPVTHFPVDKNINNQVEMLIIKQIDTVYDFVEDYSSEYVELSSENQSNAERWGFPYLNSEHCGQILDRINHITDKILKENNNNALKNIYDTWLKLLNDREDEMIRNIYRYSEANKYSKALFLVGAEHRRPIMNKILKLEKNTKQNITWVFNYL